jgi:hypothetical protein
MCQALAETLACVPIVAELDLRDNMIDEQGANALLEAMRQQLLLVKHSVVEGGVVRECGKRDLQSENKYIRCLHRVQMEGNAVQGSVANKIKKMSRFLEIEDTRFEIRAVFKELSVEGTLKFSDFQKAMTQVSGKSANAKKVFQQAQPNIKTPGDPGELEDKLLLSLYDDANDEGWKEEAAQQFSQLQEQLFDRMVDLPVAAGGASVGGAAANALEEAEHRAKEDEEQRKLEEANNARAREAELRAEQDRRQREDEEQRKLEEANIARAREAELRAEQDRRQSEEAQRRREMEEDEQKREEEQASQEPQPKMYLDMDTGKYVPAGGGVTAPAAAPDPAPFHAPEPSQSGVTPAKEKAEALHDAVGALQAASQSEHWDGRDGQGMQDEQESDDDDDMDDDSYDDRPHTDTDDIDDDDDDQDDDHFQNGPPRRRSLTVNDVDVHVYQGDGQWNGDNQGHGMRGDQYDHGHENDENTDTNSNMDDDQQGMKHHHGHHRTSSQPIPQVCEVRPTAFVCIRMLCFTAFVCCASPTRAAPSALLFPSLTGVHLSHTYFSGPAAHGTLDQPLDHHATARRSERGQHGLRPF